MAWCRQATSHYLRRCLQIFITPQDAHKGHWFNPLDAKTEILSAIVLIIHDKRAFVSHGVGLERFVPSRCWDILWRHQMEIFSAFLPFCVGNSPVTGQFPSQRQVTRSFDVFFDLRLNKRLSKQSWGWLFETPSRPFMALWRDRNEMVEQANISLFSWINPARQDYLSHLINVLRSGQRYIKTTPSSL